MWPRQSYELRQCFPQISIVKKRLLQRSRAVSVKNGNGPNLILSTKQQLLHIKNLSCLSSPSNMNMHVEDADTLVATDLPFKVKSAFALNDFSCQEITPSGENLDPQAPAERSPIP